MTLPSKLANAPVYRPHTVELSFSDIVTLQAALRLYMSNRREQVMLSQANKFPGGVNFFQAQIDKAETVNDLLETALRI